MENKFRRGLMLKLLASVCVIMILQTYLLSMSYIVQAIDENIQNVLENSIDNNMTDNEETKDIPENVVDNEDKEKDNSNTNENDVKKDETLNEDDNSEEELITGAKVTSENTTIYKGYLYANTTSETKYETNYSTIDTINIKEDKEISSLIVKEEVDKIQMTTGESLDLLGNSYYKRSKVLKEEFDKILGDNGVINLYDSNDNLIGTIDKQTAIENGYFVFEYQIEIDSIKFELINLISDGTISIINEKAIKQEVVYSRDEISLFNNINTVLNVQMVVGEDTKEINAEGNIKLEETESKMSIELDNNTLSTEKQNEVAINVTLNTNEEKYDLFENPTIEIEFPSAVDEVEIDSINLLYKNGLTLSDWDVVTNELNKKVLKINLEGSQSKYTVGSVEQGTTIVIYTKVDVNRLTSNTNENLKMTYTNENNDRNSYILENKDSENVIVSFVGRQEMLKAGRAINNTTSEIEESYNEEVKEIKVEAEGSAQMVTITGTVLNNFETATEDIAIIGRIPYAGNKDGNENDLGSKFNTILASSITTTGLVADIYYSEDLNAKKDDTTWTQDTSDITKYKSYKIVLQNGSMAKGEKIEFEFNVIVPENVGYNTKSFSTYTVYYQLNEREFSGINTVGLITEEKELTTDDTENKENVNVLEVGTQVSGCDKTIVQGDTVYERQVLTYTVVVKNASRNEVNNVKVIGKPVNANVYTWNYTKQYNYNEYDEFTFKRMKEFTNEEKEFEEFAIQTLAPGESKSFEFQVIIKGLNDIESSTKEVYNQISISADGIDEKNIETIRNKIEDAEIEIKVEKATTESLNVSDETTNSAFPILIYIKNISGRDLKNVSLDTYLPEILDVNLDISINVAANEKWKRSKEKVGNDTKLILTMDNMEKDFENTIIVQSKIKSIDYTKLEEKFSVYSVAKTENELYYSNKLTRIVYQSESKLEYSWSSDNTNETLQNEEEVNFELNIKNIGNVNIPGLFVKSSFSSGLTIIKASMIQNGKEIDLEVFEDDVMFVDYIQMAQVNVETGKTTTIKIKAKIVDGLFDTDQSVVEAKIDVTHPTYGFGTNVISYKIINENVTSSVEDPGDNNNPGGNNPGTTNPNFPNNGEPKVTYSISGKVWLDENKDGIKQNEKGIASIVAMLYRANTEGGIDTSNRIGTAITDKNGMYTFNGVEAGNYVVIFNYDSSIYNVTKYHVDTAKANENSDVVSKSIVIDGIEGIYALTDVLNVSNSSFMDIDMGLVTRNNFDLALDKYISTVKVKNKSGTKLYDYANGTNNKIEIPSKFYKTTELEITYKIIITNEGDVSGYVNKIADYLPQGTSFDINQNKGWYFGDDGNVYYNGLMEREIKPGDKVEVPLVLKQSLASGETIKILNGAEIIECTNSNGYTDIDSVPGNKEKAEDDYGEALLTATVSTGRIIKENIISLFMSTIAVSIIIILIKNKKLKKFYR